MQDHAEKHRVKQEMSSAVEVLDDHVTEKFWVSNLRNFSGVENHLNDGLQDVRQHDEIMNMPRNTKLT